MKDGPDEGHPQSQDIDGDGFEEDEWEYALDEEPLFEEKTKEKPKSRPGRHSLKDPNTGRFVKRPAG